MSHIHSYYNLIVVNMMGRFILYPWVWSQLGPSYPFSFLAHSIPFLTHMYSKFDPGVIMPRPGMDRGELLGLRLLQFFLFLEDRTIEMFILKFHFSFLNQSTLSFYKTYFSAKWPDVISTHARIAHNLGISQWDSALTQIYPLYHDFHLPWHLIWSFDDEAYHLQKREAFLTPSSA